MLEASFAFLKASLVWGYEFVCAQVMHEAVVYKFHVGFPDGGEECDWAVVYQFVSWGVFTLVEEDKCTVSPIVRDLFSFPCGVI